MEKPGFGCAAIPQRRQDEDPAVYDDAAPEHLESHPFIDQVVGVELDTLEDEVVKDVEREECCIEEDARVEIAPKLVVVPRRAGHGIERQHGAANDVEIHLDIDAFPKQRNLLRSPLPQREQRILDVSLWLGVDRRDGHDQGEDGASCDGVQG